MTSELLFCACPPPPAAALWLVRLGEGDGGEGPPSALLLIAQRKGFPQEAAAALPAIEACWRALGWMGMPMTTGNLFLPTFKLIPICGIQAY